MQLKMYILGYTFKRLHQIELLNSAVLYTNSISYGYLFKQEQTLFSQAELEEEVINV